MIAAVDAAAAASAAVPDAGVGARCLNENCQKCHIFSQAEALIVNEAGPLLYEELKRRFGEMRDGLMWLMSVTLLEEDYHEEQTANEESGKFLTVPAAAAVAAARTFLERKSKLTEEQWNAVCPEPFRTTFQQESKTLHQLEAFALGAINAYTGRPEPLRAFPELHAELVELYYSFSAASIPAESAFSRVKANNKDNTTGKTQNLDVAYRGSEGSLGKTFIYCSQGVRPTVTKKGSPQPPFVRLTDVSLATPQPPSTSIKRCACTQHHSSDYA